MNRRTFRRTGLAGSHQRSWLWGRHAVLETLQAGRWPIVELLADEQQTPDLLEQLRRLADRQGCRLQLVPASRIEQLCHAPDHQGCLARMGPFPCESLADLERLLSTETLPAKFPPLLVVCDRLQDAHNFGAILRCCDAMAVTGVVIGQSGQVPVTPHVARASSGAVNSQRLFEVPDLVQAIGCLRECGITVLAATEKASQPVWNTRLDGPLAVVIGTEATGIAPSILEQCTAAISIPMFGRINSLNAAVAAGILLFECRRQQSATRGQG